MTDGKKWNGTDWVPSPVVDTTATLPLPGREAAPRVDHRHQLAVGDPASASFAAEASPGTSESLARADHVHAMPVDPTIAHLADGDPHPQYATDADLAAAQGDLGSDLVALGESYAGRFMLMGG